jgi:hypothetical protein
VPTALVAQVSYKNGDDSTNWILDSGSTHHMNGFANEFFDMKLEGYDDGILVKGLVSGTKAYGIGSCIVVVKDSSGMYHQLCLEDVLYVPNLLHHHPRVFSVISACSQDEYECHFQSTSYVLNIKVANIDLHLSKGLLWIPTVDPSTVPSFVSVTFKIRDADQSMMLLVHNGLNNSISIPGGYVKDNENHIECGLRVVTSLLGIRLQRHNQLFLRNSSTILLDSKNPIRHHTYQCEFWLEELDSMMCSDTHVLDQLGKQFRKAPGLVYQLTNYKPDYSDDRDYGLLLYTDVVSAAVLSHSPIYGFMFSTVSPLFDLWSLGDTLSRIFPYKLNGAYFMNASGTFPVP